MGKSLAVPDGYTYSYVVNGCAKGVLLSEGEQVHGKIMRDGCFSDVFLQTNLVNFYSVKGSKYGIGSAEKVFDEMTDRTVVAWNSLISGHFRCGNVDEARRIFHGMPERNVVSWTAMIAGSAQNERCKEALSFFHEMGRNGVEFDQRWQSVANVRQKMFEIRAKKPPDQSCIQIDGVSHGFLAGDTTHKHANLIYEMLDEITGQAKLQVDEVCP
ncbi:pentatricopeptide repeat-containing protein At1g71460, chloroplastic-like [Ipomoea triloba]|uniref:pentatricopeptide repeat-containing protein At1g71460, chloroplastic-like n=1 Tax=Ipomoea triloba TaxID=35885 RepID=UPI00125E0E28|nr:pentatricopeptide repeat-containing protein At1g71460, chloroplastic-like [Ipomoea triloba]